MTSNWKKVFINKNNIIASSDKSYLLNLNNKKVWVPHKNVKGDSIIQINICCEWTYSTIEDNKEVKVLGTELIKNL